MPPPACVRPGCRNSRSSRHRPPGSSRGSRASRCGRSERRIGRQGAWPTTSTGRRRRLRSSAIPSPTSSAIIADRPGERRSEKRQSFTANLLRKRLRVDRLGIGRDQQHDTQRGAGQESGRREPGSLPPPREGIGRGALREIRRRHRSRNLAAASSRRQGRRRGHRLRTTFVLAIRSWRPCLWALKATSR